MMDKQLLTQRAQAALAGYALHAIRNDLERPVFIATAGPITMCFEDSAEVDRWLRTLPVHQVEEGHA